MISRRTVLSILGGAAGMALVPWPAWGSDRIPIAKAIPSTGESIPPIGMGSSVTFNVGDDPKLRDTRCEVLRAFFDSGGGMIDSSPMYGSSEEVIGHCLARLPETATLFSATKVWTRGREDGIEQMRLSASRWGVERFDLMQIHNLIDWEVHLETLLSWKQSGKVRYIGITTSHGRRSDDLLKIITQHPFDFVQLTYNVLDRDAEHELLPAAAERKIAVIVNRPFRRAELFDRVGDHPLPPWAGEIDCANWAQFFLKFIVSHPHVTCAIPATSRVDHMRENMGAAFGRLPDAATRERMSSYVAAI